MKTVKYLQSVKDGYCISHPGDAYAPNADWREIEVPAGENPQPHEYLSESDLADAPAPKKGKSKPEAPAE